MRRRVQRFTPTTTRENTRQARASAFIYIYTHASSNTHRYHTPSAANWLWLRTTFLKIVFFFQPVSGWEAHLTLCTVCCLCMLSKREWEADERRSQVWVYSYYIRGLSDIQGKERIQHAFWLSSVQREGAAEEQQALLQHPKTRSIGSCFCVEYRKLKDLTNRILENVEMT